MIYRVLMWQLIFVFIAFMPEVTAVLSESAKRRKERVLKGEKL